VNAATRMRALAWFARQWVGFKEEGGQNKGQVVELFQRAVDGKAQGEPWCAAFLQFCVMRVDDLFEEMTMVSAVRSRLYRSELCMDLVRYTPEDCRVTEPVPGAVVVWSKLQGGLPSAQGHCGIVHGIYDGGVVTVEGNTGMGDQREGDGVSFKRRARGDIPGFVRLAWLAPWGTP
jgi:hypothetical protein